MESFVGQDVTTLTPVIWNTLKTDKSKQSPQAVRAVLESVGRLPREPGKANVFNFESVWRCTGVENRSVFISKRLPGLNLRQKLDAVEYLKPDTVKKLAWQLLEALLALDSERVGIAPGVVCLEDLYVSEETGDLKMDLNEVIINPLMAAGEEELKRKRPRLDPISNFALILIQLLTPQPMERKDMNSMTNARIQKIVEDFTALEQIDEQAK